MINKKFLKLITCTIISICVYENNTYSMDKIYGDNSIEQISNNDQETMLNTETNDEKEYSNIKFTRTLDEIFKSEEWFNFKPKKEWPGQYTQEEKDRYAKYVDCKDIEEGYEKELIKSYNETSQQYDNIYSNKVNSFINDVSWVFQHISGKLSIRNPYQYPEEYWQENTFVSADTLIKYKQLFDKCVSNNNINNSIQNELIQAMEDYISNANINDKYISIYDLYYYVRNKLLQVGNSVVQNLNKTGNYKSVTASNKNIVVNCLSNVQNILTNLTNDLYSSKNIIKKQINEKKIKEKLERTAISLDREGKHLVIPYPSYKGLLNYCNYQINQLYKNHYHEVISSKVDKLHKNIINTLDNVISKGVSNINVKGKTYYGFSDDILRENTNIHPSKYKGQTLNDKFSDDKTMSLKEYLKESKAYIDFIKKCYDDNIKLLYDEIQYSDEMKQYHEEQYNKALEEQKQGKLKIVKCGNSPSDENLAYKFNSYTEDYIEVVKHLLGNILQKNKIPMPALEELLKKIAKSKKEIIDGKIL